jgi:hypothetical protein
MWRTRNSLTGTSGPGAPRGGGPGGAEGRAPGPGTRRGRRFRCRGRARCRAPRARAGRFASDAWAAGLDRLTDDELIGVMRAARRLSSWAAAMELACVADLWRRRTAEEDAGDTGAARHADDEIAAALTLTGRAADRVLDLAIALRRLPLTSQALAAGDIDLPRAMVVADEVTGSATITRLRLSMPSPVRRRARPPGSCAPPPAARCWPRIPARRTGARSAPSRMRGSNGGTSMPGPPPWRGATFPRVGPGRRPAPHRPGQAAEGRRCPRHHGHPAR